MIAEIGSLIASSKAAYDIAKGLGSVYVDDKVRERTSELLNILLSVQANALAVQANHQELLIVKDDLEKKILEFENWSETVRQYELKEVAPGVFVYSCKTPVNSSEPAHWLCAKCFQEKKVHIIQLDHESAGVRHYFCPNCSTKYNIRHNSSGASSPSRGSGGSHGWMGA